jgi:hypothetical protein
MVIQNDQLIPHGQPLEQVDHFGVEQNIRQKFFFAFHVGFS